jgi:hypothetical protein
MTRSFLFLSPLEYSEMETRRVCHATRDSLMSSPPGSRTPISTLGGGASVYFPLNGVCKQCNTQGHWVKDCSEADCYHCGTKGHIIEDCPKKATVHCYGCKEFGHIKKKCPQNVPRETGIEAHDELREARRVLQETRKEIDALRQELDHTHEQVQREREYHARHRARAAEMIFQLEGGE